MIHLLESFGCGICFAIGAVVGVNICSLITTKGRAELAKEMRDHAKRVEDRLATQIATMACCLDEIKKHKDA